MSRQDQVHTTGTDISQAVSSRAALTLGKDMTFRDLAQGAYRMRGIGQGQTVELLVPPAILRTHYLLLTTLLLAILLLTTLLLTTYYPTTYHSPLTTYSLLLTTHYSLLTTHYSLLTTHYSLLTIHYSTTALLTTHYSLQYYSLLTTSLLTTHYSLLTTHYSTTALLSACASCDPQSSGLRNEESEWRAVRYRISGGEDVIGRHHRLVTHQFDPVSSQ